MKVFILDEYPEDAKTLKSHISLLAEQVDACFDFNTAVHDLRIALPDVLVLNINVISRLRELDIPIHRTQIIVIADLPEPEYLRLCMSINAVDLLIKPLQFSDLQAAFQKIKFFSRGYPLSSESAATPIQKSKAGKVISFFSALPQIGQTLFSVNVATQIAQSELAVVWWTSDIPSIQDSISHATGFHREFNQVLYPEILGVDVLVNTADLGDQLTAEHIFSIITKLKKEYDVIVIDLLKMVNPATMMTLNLSDILIYTIRLDKTVFSEIQQSLDQLKGVNIMAKNIFIISNENQSMPSISKKDAEELLTHKIQFLIPPDPYVVTQSAQKNEPFSLAFPESLISQKLQGLTQQILDRIAIK